MSVLRASLLSVTMLCPSLAVAAEGPVPEDTSSTVEIERSERSLKLDVGFRFRRLSVPKGLLDIWFTDSDLPGWPLPGQDRPLPTGWVWGLEFGFSSERSHGIVWFEWIDSSMDEGYWDDVEAPPNLVDGDYLRPTRNFGLMAFGADYAFEVPFVKLGQTDGVFGLGLIVGGGLGLGLMVGELEQWVPSETDVPAYVLYEQGEPPNGEKNIPRVFPMVDVNLALRMNFADRFTLRLEGGLHTALYYGAAATVRF